MQPKSPTLQLEAAIVRQRRSIYDMKATLHMDGEEMAQASARFMDPS